MLHTLLLDSSYRCLSFITEKKVFKHLSKNTIDILESWDEIINFGQNIKIKHPAVAKLDHQVKWTTRNLRFNKTQIFRRDNYLCQYCGYALTTNTATIDHVIPKAKGGQNSWENCVTACGTCNNFKSQKTLAEAKMTLLNKPATPVFHISKDYELLNIKHSSWKNYINI